MNPLFSSQDISIFYGKKEIVHGVSLAIAPGQLCALLGPNGSGKTTLIRGLCGFLPCKGKVCIMDQDCTRMKERDRAKLISYIPQTLSVQDGRSVLDAVMLGYAPHLHLLENPTAEQKSHARALLQAFGMSGKENLDFSTLSVGEKQLVILARCLAQSTPVMLMDEPDSSLDFLHRQEIFQQIRKNIADHHDAGLISVHDPNLALAYCDRLFLLKGGKQVGEINTATASSAQIQQELSKIYGPIAVECWGGGYYVHKKE